MTYKQLEDELTWSRLTDAIFVEEFGPYKPNLPQYRLDRIKFKEGSEESLVYIIHKNGFSRLIPVTEEGHFHNFVAGECYFYINRGTCRVSRIDYETAKEAIRPKI